MSGDFKSQGEAVDSKRPSREFHSGAEVTEDAVDEENCREKKEKEAKEKKETKKEDGDPTRRRLAALLHSVYDGDPIACEEILSALDERSVENLVEALESKLRGERCIRPPSKEQLLMVACASCIPFIGFGFVDNFVMIVAGDLFDTTLCVRLAFSTLTAAALGNLISDLLGIALGGTIENIANRIGSFNPNLSKSQMDLPVTRRWYHFGCGVGVAIGCILGMAPLLLLDTDEAERRKQQKKQHELFVTVSRELATYLQAEKVVVYLVERVPIDQLEAPPLQARPSSLHPHPAWAPWKPEADVTDSDIASASAVSQARVGSTRASETAAIAGTPLGAAATYEEHDVQPRVEPKKKDDCLKKLRRFFRGGRDDTPTSSKGRQVRVHFVSKDPHTAEEIRLDMDEGIPGQVYRTGKLINWRKADVPPASAVASSGSPSTSEPPGLWWPFVDPVVPGESNTTRTPPGFYSDDRHKTAKQILGAPVFGVKGQVIGVLEVINPQNRDNFTKRDKELLISVSSHLAVEIEGKQHITNILEMCRKQVASRSKSITRITPTPYDGGNLEPPSSSTLSSGRSSVNSKP